MNLLELFEAMPASERVGGLVFMFGTPVLFWALWTMTPA